MNFWTQKLQILSSLPWVWSLSTFVASVVRACPSTLRPPVCGSYPNEIAHCTPLEAANIRKTKVPK